MREPLRIFTILLFMLGCRADPVVLASVQDRWGNTISGASIRVTGTQFVTGSNGQVQIPAWSGETTAYVGREGYLPATVTHTVPDGEDVVIPSLDVQLYRKPDPRDDIYLIGERDYERIDSREVLQVRVGSSVGDDIVGLRMSRNVPTVTANREIEIVWASTHDLHMIQQQNPRVRRLEYVESIMCGGLHGGTPCEVDLHVVDGLTLGRYELLGTEQDTNFYIYRVEEDIERGNYVLYLDEILERSGDELVALSPQLRIAYPFMIR